jgi:hypothetical protein
MISKIAARPTQNFFEQDSETVESSKAEMIFW